MPYNLDVWLHVIYGFLHDIGIAVYIGGAISMEFVLGPAQGSIPPAQAQVMGQKTADRFLWFVWGSLALIVVTGILRLEKLGRLEWSWPFFTDSMKLSNDYGRTVWTMFALWCVLCINGFIITFILRPRLQGKLGSGAGAAHVAAAQSAKMQAATWVQRITRADVVIAITIAFLGASLKWGGVL
ncbi:MAG: CopD family protein [Dehalococcoidia bacterium]|nr:CopD family protein [Dehalococcoidia bacterium]